MSLTPEQKQTVSGWVAAGDNLSTIQKKLTAEFKLSMTYMDVRFLVDDLNLQLKDPAPKPTPADVAHSAPAHPPGAAGAPAPKAGPPARSNANSAPAESATDAPSNQGFEDSVPDEAPEDFPAGNLHVAVDKITLIPGALASGTVTFSDGVTGKWIVDNQGRPGFTEVSKPGYRPTPADGQAFMQQLSAALQKLGY